MGVKLKNNIAVVTSAGNIFDTDGSETREGKPIQSIQAVANADNSECLIVDDDGVEVFYVKSALTGERTFAPLILNGKSIRGMNCTVWINMTKVIIHFR